MAPAWEITPTPSAVTDRPDDHDVRFTYRVLSVWGHGTFDKSQFPLFRKHFGLFSPGNPQIPVNHRGWCDATERAGRTRPSAIRCARTGWRWRATSSG